MNPRIFPAVLLLTSCLLSGCGFTLRGAADLSPDLQSLVLVSADGNSDISRELTRSLRASNVTLIDNADAGTDTYQLLVGNTRSSERVLSVNSNARAGEYELTVSVPIQLRRGGEVVMPTETLSIAKVYLADPNSAVAKAEERELMEGEMRRELVNQILRRLQNTDLAADAG